VSGNGACKDKAASLVVLIAFISFHSFYTILGSVDRAIQIDLHYSVEYFKVKLLVIVVGVSHFSVKSDSGTCDTDLERTKLIDCLINGLFYLRALSDITFDREKILLTKFNFHLIHHEFIHVGNTNFSSLVVKTAGGLCTKSRGPSSNKSY
jgi:hypothetical protein